MKIMSNSTLKMKNEIPLVTVPFRPSLRKHAFYGILALVSLLGLGITQTARASFMVTMNEVGGNVVANGSGSFNLTGLTNIGPFLSTGNSLIGGTTGRIAVSPTANLPLFGYSGFTTAPTTFGSLGQINANSASGDPFNVNSSTGRIFLLRSYVSGSVFSDSMTFNNKTFATLGLTPDSTYVWTWGTGANADSFTLQIGSVPDTGSTLSLLGFASLGLVALRRKLRC
jgi:hypothetical protein